MRGTWHILMGHSIEKCGTRWNIQKFSRCYYKLHHTGHHVWPSGHILFCACL